jgi:elongation factor G
MAATNLTIDMDTIDKIRNIGFVAHIDAGKTTTTERILFYSGRAYKIGEVDEGTTITDWMKQERERGITITSAATYCRWRDYNINIIDTPGHIDFTVEVERSLKVLDGAVVIFCAVGGVQPQSETVWRQADKYNLPRIVYINKLDRMGADFNAVVEEIKDKLGVNAAALNVPIYEDDKFKGIIDLITRQAVYFTGDFGEKVEYADLDERLKQKCEKWRDHLVDILSAMDDEFMNKFISKGSLSEADFNKVIRDKVLENKFYPILCGSSLKNKGVQPLLNAICNFLPSPKDLKTISGITPKKGEVEQRKMSYDAPFAALCFKVFTDPFVGKLFYTRVYSGKVSTSSMIYNASKKNKEKITKIIRMHANRQQILKEAKAGDIVCLVGLKDTSTGDTLTEAKHPLLLETMKFPEPVVSMAIEPKTKADQEKLLNALKNLEEEDPSFKISYNKDTGQNVISGMGKLHLEIVVDRLLGDFKVKAKVGKPQVTYKETITKSVETVAKFMQPTAGKEQYAHVVLLMQPNKKGGVVFENQTKSSIIPNEFIGAVREGVLDAANSGILGGFLVTDLKVTLIDGSYDQANSSELAFKIAAEMAFKDGLRKAESVLLEPIMDLEVIVPEQYLSRVIADLNTRRAKIISIKDRKQVKALKAEVPLREIFDYVDVLRNLTQGRGSYTIEPLCYDEVPKEVFLKILGM